MPSYAPITLQYGIKKLLSDLDALLVPGVQFDPAATSLDLTDEYHLLRLDSNGFVEQKFFLEAYVPISQITSHDAPGEKGQWSIGAPSFQDDPNPSLWICAADDTWIDCIDSESWQWYLDQWVTSTLPSLVQTIVYAFSDDQYVPSSQITDQNSAGKKGQWSYQGQYFYICVASDTWARYAVETDFTK